MSAVVPNTEPQSFTAGETLAWTKSLPGYDSATYTLKYALQASGQSNISITASADGSGGFAVNVAAATTAAYTPGVYIWTSFAESSGGTVRTIVGRGSVSILPSPTAALPSTHATRTLALVEAALENRIPNGLESTDIDGQRLDRIPVVELAKLHAKYRGMVDAEADALRVRSGLRSRRTSFARFRPIAG